MTQYKSFKSTFFIQALSWLPTIGCLFPFSLDRYSPGAICCRTWGTQNTDGIAVGDSGVPVFYDGLIHSSAKEKGRLQCLIIFSWPRCGSLIKRLLLSPHTQNSCISSSRKQSSLRKSVSLPQSMPIRTGAWKISNILFSSYQLFHSFLLFRHQLNSMLRHQKAKYFLCKNFYNTVYKIMSLFM